MQEDRSQRDSIEHSLSDLRSMEDAGVFGRSRVNAEAMLSAEVASARPGKRSRPSGRTPSGAATRVGGVGIRRLWVGLGLAASLALVVGVWSAMFYFQITGLRKQVASGHGATVSLALNAGGMTRCFNGPSGTLPDECRELDLDGDGDMDLADFGAYQVAMANAGR